MSGWTDERTAALIQMRRDGRTGTYMARKLKVTRASVVCKLARLEGRQEPDEDAIRTRGSWDAKLFESWGDRKARLARERGAHA